MDFHMTRTSRILVGSVLDVLPTIPDASIHCCVTSPPYWRLRDYGVEGQLGLEETPVEYVAKMVVVFREVRRVLRDDGTLWLNLGDSYAGSWGAQGRTGQMADRSVFSARQIEAHPKKGSGLKPKDLVGIPWRVAFALQADGWYLRADVIWAKSNPMPESVTDRPTKAHEYVFLLSKLERYHYDARANAELAAYPEGPGGPSKPRPGIDDYKGGNQGNGKTYGAGKTRNARTVWTIPSKPYAEAHFATMPPALAKRCVLAG